MAISRAGMAVPNASKHTDAVLALAGDSLAVTVVGAGLAGSMLALLLSHTGQSVRVLEKRPDLRVELQQDVDALGLLTDSSKRSINLALSHRGICALKQAGLWERVQPLLIPMKGRVIHALDGSTTFQPYGEEKEAIWSVPRAQLNAFLLEELDKQYNVQLMFNTKVDRIDPFTGDVHLKTKDMATHYTSKVVVGADGAFSSVRDSLSKSSRLNYSQEFMEVGYREFTIRRNAEGDFALPNPESLHIWPRHEFMMIALPNPDKTFTATLFLPWVGENGFEALNDDEAILDFFRRNFHDLLPLFPDLLEQYAEGCASPLLTIVCHPWACSRAVLIGDAAHAAAPFYGQGMNAAFEDALQLYEMWSAAESKQTPEEVLRQFSNARQPAGAALCKLSLANFREMSSLTARSWFIWKKRLEAVLHRLMPSYWVPLYTMVSFTRMPYHHAVLRARRQDRVLGWISVLVSTLSVAAAALALKRARR